MKWLLFTAFGNPGDEFVRIGIENLLRQVDPNAEFYAIHKHSPGIIEPVEFDYSVVCGMPLAWSHDTEATWREHWWNPLKGWISDGKRLFLAGVGSFAEWPDCQADNQARLHNEITALLERSIDCYARDPIFCRITGLTVPVMPCPSIFACDGLQQTERLKLCNFMPDGAHYAKYGVSEAHRWMSIRGRVATILLRHGFRFIAHDWEEMNLAEMLGWPRDAMICNNGNPRHLLAAYANAGMYFGNRIHGAIVSRSVGAKVWSVGYDSRQEAARLVGARVTLPSGVSLFDLDEWCESGSGKEMDLESERQKQLAVFREVVL